MTSGESERRDLVFLFALLRSAATTAVLCVLLTSVYTSRNRFSPPRYICNWINRKLTHGLKRKKLLLKNLTKALYSAAITTTSAARLCLHTFVIDFEYSVRLEGIKDRTKAIRERFKSIQNTPTMPGFYHTLKVFTYSKLVSHLLHLSSFKYKTFRK